MLRLTRALTCLATRLTPLAVFGSTLFVAPPALAGTASVPGDLSVTLSGPDTGVVGTPVPVSVTVTNTTTTTTTLAGSQIVMLVFGASAQIRGGVQNPTGGACARNGPAEQFCAVPGIAPGASATLNFSVDALVPGTLSASAAQAFTGSPGIATINMSIAPAPTDVQVSGFASTGSPARGANYAYTFQVMNNGALNCDLGDIAVGGQTTVTVTVQAPPTPQTYTDTATVAMADTDRQPSNNSVAVTVQVK
jgi:hypothetical protein